MKNRLRGLFRRIFPAKRIVDHSRRRGAPERLPAHWLYALLAILSITAALWGYGHPGFTLTVILMAPFVALLAYIPYRVLPSWTRFFLQLALIAAAGVWCFHRFREGTPTDKALAEVLALSILVFLPAQRLRDYGYIFALAILLLVYGALLPRTIYLWSLGGGVGVTLYLLYNNRIRQLAASPALVNPRRIIRRNWHFILLHLGLSAILFAMVFPLFPTVPSETRGVFAVGFAHEKESMLPPDLRSWFSSEKALKDANGERTVEGGRPDTLEKTGTPIAVKSKETASFSPSGSGAAPPGQDMIFRMKSPVKLYHLAQLYDQYDGANWVVSPNLKRGRLRRTRLGAEPYRHITSRYTILKWMGPKLYAPYRPFAFEQPGGIGFQSLTTTFYNAELSTANYPRPPFAYTVTSMISTDLTPAASEPEPLHPERKPVPGKKPPPPPEKVPPRWDETISPKNYTRLPPKVITKRLREKVAELTADAANDYEKALLLRNYLRDNFTYKQFSKPVPEGAEAADYFFFELKEGHCEYFASTLAVMARIAGLPSRIATGFSPGDYNTLINAFEVYEYHAHAWTQIFVPDYGWLTMDATPPGEIQSRTTPIGLGQLRDPFGDEWRVTPPELTTRTLEILREAYLKQMQGDPDSKSSDMLAQVSQLEEGLRNKVKEAYRKVAPKGSQVKKVERPRTALERTLLTTREAVERAVGFLKRHRFEAAACLTVLLTAWVTTRVLLRGIRRRRQKELAQRFREDAGAAIREADYRRAVDAAYRAARLELQLAGMPERRGLELLDYAAFLCKKHPELGELPLELFRAFYLAAYNPEPPARETGERAVACADELHARLFPER